MKKMILAAGATVALALAFAVPSASAATCHAAYDGITNNIEGNGAFSQPTTHPYYENTQETVRFGIKGGTGGDVVAWNGQGSQHASENSALHEPIGEGETYVDPPGQNACG